MGRKGPLKLLRIYGREAWRMRWQHPYLGQAQQLRRLYPRWRQSLRDGANPLGDASPWMTFAAIDFLGDLLSPKSRVFEYGSGGSSLFLSRRAAEVVSVEHDPAWAGRVQEALAREGRSNARVVAAAPELPQAGPAPDPADPDAYGTADDALRHHRFRQYAASIDPFAPGYFAIIIIDGRARPSCLRHALPKVAPGGWLVLDNAEREHYRVVHRTLDGPEWKKHVLAGPGPYNDYFWETCFWQRIA